VIEDDSLDPIPFPGEIIQRAVWSVTSNVAIVMLLQAVELTDVDNTIGSNGVPIFADSNRLQELLSRIRMGRLCGGPYSFETSGIGDRIRIRHYFLLFGD
jgi:hypothetical protein